MYINWIVYIIFILTTDSKRTQRVRYTHEFIKLSNIYKIYIFTTFVKTGDICWNECKITYYFENTYTNNKNVMKTFIALRQPNVFLFSQRTNSIIYLWSRLNFKCNGDTPVDHKCLFYKLCTTNDFAYTTRYITRCIIT